MFLVIHQTSSAYTCFKEAEIPHPTPPLDFKIFKSLSLKAGIEPVISEKTTTYVLSAHIAHLESGFKNKVQQPEQIGWVGSKSEEENKARTQVKGRTWKNFELFVLQKSTWLQT